MDIRDDQNSSSQSSESRRKKKPLIPVVDDQTTIIRIMSKMLKPHYDLCVATDGQKAIDVARNMLPDLILMDNLMPAMTGVEACGILKNDPLTEKFL